MIFGCAMLPASGGGVEPGFGRAAGVVRWVGGYAGGQGWVCGRGGEHWSRRGRESEGRTWSPSAAGGIGYRSSPCSRLSPLCFWAASATALLVLSMMTPEIIR